ARSFENLQPDASEFKNITILKRRECIRHLGGCSQANAGTNAIAQFQMPRDEVGMEVGQEHILDLQPVLGGEGNILVRVALWVHDNGRAGRLVSYDIGGVRQTGQVELLEDQGTPDPRNRLSLWLGNNPKIRLG